MGGSSSAIAGSITADSLIVPGYRLSAGWSYGNTGDAVVPSQDDPRNEKDETDLLFALTATIGTNRSVNSEIKFILTNFGRLVSPVFDSASDLKGFDFSPDSAGTSVRRAMIVDLSVRSPALTFAQNRSMVMWTLVNTGFLFDAQANQSQAVQDAASYLFTGPTLMSALGGRSAVIADLFVGVSEVLTGREAFDLNDKQHLRFRPRLRFRLGDGPFGDKPVDVGFWADLGVDENEPDAFTVFVAVPIVEVP
jgi:hypothetical protein